MAERTCRRNSHGALGTYAGFKPEPLTREG
jgi:hypothetical protein